jgi:hypothetical protein
MSGQSKLSFNYHKLKILGVNITELLSIHFHSYAASYRHGIVFVAHNFCIKDFQLKKSIQARNKEKRGGGDKLTSSIMKLKNSNKIQSEKLLCWKVAGSIPYKAFEMFFSNLPITFIFHHFS